MTSRLLAAARLSGLLSVAWALQRRGSFESTRGMQRSLEELGVSQLQPITICAFDLGSWNYQHLDDTLWLRRAHSIGHLRQTLNMLTYALGINALALHRQRHAPPIAA